MTTRIKLHIIDSDGFEHQYVVDATDRIFVYIDESNDVTARSDGKRLVDPAEEAKKRMAEMDKQFNGTGSISAQPLDFLNQRFYNLGESGGQGNKRNARD